MELPQGMALTCLHLEGGLEIQAVKTLDNVTAATEIKQGLRTIQEEQRAARQWFQPEIPFTAHLRPIT